MQSHEYLAVPAPAKGAKVKGLKTPAERFAHALSATINDLAAEGWEYWRAETLPCEERKGLTGSVTAYHSVLIFRRPSAEALANALPVAVPAGTTPLRAGPAQETSVLAPVSQAAAAPTTADQNLPGSAGRSADEQLSARELMAEAENLFAPTDDAEAPSLPAAPIRLSTRAPEGPAPRVVLTPREDRLRDD